MSDPAEKSEVQTTQPEPTLRDDVRSAVEELKSSDKHKEDATKIADAERKRDPAGRFVPKEGDEPGKKRETLTLPKGAEKPAQAGAAPAAPEPTKPAIKPPEGWKPEMKARFAELPPEIQAEIARRETEIHKTVTAQDQERQLAKQFRETTQPYQHILAAENTSPIEAFKAFLNYAYIMRAGTPQQKLAALQNVARQYNVPISAPASAPASDPRLETFQQRLDRIERERQDESRQRQQAESQALHSEIDAFAAQPGHEHFSEYRDQMAKMLDSGIAESLQDAYDKALKLAGLPTAEDQRKESERVAAEKAKTDAAKRASGSVTGAPGGAKPNGRAANPNEALRDTIRAAIAEHSGRA